VGSPTAVGALKPSTQQIEHETREKEKEEEQPAGEKTKASTEPGGSEPGPGVETPKTETTPTSPVVVLQQSVPASSSSSTATLKPKPSVLTSIRISSLSLSPNAIFALNSGGERISAIRFSFRINGAALVRVTLSRQVREGGHLHWRAVGATETIKATEGTNNRGLSAHGKLAAGRYLLTLAPVQGRSRWLVLRSY
jgi:hypothetical protein